MSGNQPNDPKTISPTSMAIKRLKLADAEGDSTMHSSPELIDEMFPDEGEAGGPSTPRNAASFAIGSSELSPPNSQGPSNLPRNDLSAALAGSPSLNENGKRILAPAPSTSAEGHLRTDPETGYRWSRQEDEPGWDWKNPRARDEGEKAWEQIVDKGAMIKSGFCLDMFHS